MVPVQDGVSTVFDQLLNYRFVCSSRSSESSVCNIVGDVSYKSAISYETIGGLTLDQGGPSSTNANLLRFLMGEGLSMRFGRSAARVVVIAAVVSSALAVGVEVSSAEPAPRFGYFGDDLWTLGDHAFCAGIVHVDLDVDRTRPGHVLASFSSPGFRGNGPEWTSNPHCNLVVQITHTTPVLPLTNIAYVPLSLGEGPQAPTRIDLFTGSGAASVDFKTNFLNKQVNYAITVP